MMTELHDEMYDAAIDLDDIRNPLPGTDVATKVAIGLCPPRNHEWVGGVSTPLWCRRCKLAAVTLEDLGEIDLSGSEDSE